MKKSNGISCLSIFLFVVLVFCAGVIVVSCGRQEEPTVTQLPIATSLPTSTNTPLPTETFETREPSIEHFNFLLLGGDWRESRKGTRWGGKTDVMLLVKIEMSDPIKIRVIQFPRNLYHPVESFPDLWLFSIYGKEGFVGLHYYFQQVFDVDLQGIAYIHMDNFEHFVDDLGGLYLNNLGGDNPTIFDGEQSLEYLRDNDNNWGCPAYDCSNRQFTVLLALAQKIKTQFYENAYVTTGLLIDSYGHLFDTDLSEFEQVHWLVELGWHITMSDYEIEFDKVTTSGVAYNDTPLNVRGWTIPDVIKMQEWLR